MMTEKEEPDQKPCVPPRDAEAAKYDPGQSLRDREKA